MSEPLVLKVDASELEAAQKKMDEFAASAEKVEASNDSLAKSFADSANAAGAASAGYDKLTVMQRAYVDGNQAIIKAYEAEYASALQTLKAEADGYTKLTASQRAYLDAHNELLAQEQAEASVLAQLAQAQQASAQASQAAAAASQQVAASQSAAAVAAQKYLDKLSAQRDALRGLNFGGLSAAMDEARTKMDAQAESVERNRLAHQRWQQQGAITDAQLLKEAGDVAFLSGEVQELVKKYDPLGQKLAELQAAYKALGTVQATGGGDQVAIARAMGNLDAAIGKVKDKMSGLGHAGAEAGGVVAGGMEKAEKGALAAALGSSMVTRELITMGREAAAGNFARLPGSFSLMLQGAGKLEAALSFLLNPFTLLAAAIGGVALMMAKGQAEAEHLDVVLAATGNFAGTTAEDFNKMADRVSNATTLTVRNIKSIGVQMLETGKYSADNIEQMARFVDNFAFVTGKSVEETSKHLIELFKDPAKAAEELDGVLHSLEPGELQRIKNLQDEGKYQEAVTRALDDFNSRIPQHIEYLGAIETAWMNVKKAVSSAIDAIMSFGTPDQEIKILEAAIAAARKINGTVFGELGKQGRLQVVPTSGLEANLAILKKMTGERDAQLKTEHELTEQQQAQKDALAAADKYASDASKRSELLAAKQKLGMFTGDDPEQAAKVVEAIQKIDEALANLGKKKPTEFTRVMDQVAKMGADAALAYASFGKSVEDQSVPALKLLHELEASHVWKDFSASQREQIANELNRIAGVQKSTKAMEDQQKAQAALVKLQAGYAQAEAQASKIDASARSAAINAAASAALAANKRMFDEGLVDFKTFYETETAIQQQQLDNQVANQQQAVDEQKASVKAMADQLAHLDISQFGGSMEKWLTEAVKLSGQLKVALANLGKATTDLGIAQNKAADSGGDYVERFLIPANKLILDTVPALKSQLEQQQLANATYGLAASSVQELIAAKDEELLQQARAKPNNEKEVAFLQEQIALRKELAATLRQGEDQKALLDVIKSVDDEAKQLWDDMWSGGHDTFQKLGADLKKYVLDLLFQMTVRPFIINVAAQLTGINANNAAGALGGGNSPLASLLGGKGGGLLTSGITGAAGSFATSTAGQALGLSGPTFGVEAAGDIGLTAAGNTFMAAAGTFAQAVPYIGLAVTALSALGVFDHKPSPAKGQFQVSEGTTGFEDNAFAKGPFGLNLGFSDANTQQFSGDAAKVFDQVVSGALQAFSTRFAPEQSAQFAEVLKKMTFDTFEGTFTTEDFLQKYGGQVLQQVVTAAFQILDPALASVVQGFQGTADEVAAFSNTLLSIYDATKQLNNSDLAANVDAALQGADQDTADKVLAFVTIVREFGDSIEGLGPKLEALDPSSMTAFVDALGGAQNAVDTLAFINDNFTTSAQKAAQAQLLLSQGFAALNLQVPKTHADFLDLLGSFDLTTEAGRKMYASVAALAPLFVTVAGTADNAVKALNGAAEAFRQIGQNALDNPQVDTSPTAAVQFIRNTVRDIVDSTEPLPHAMEPFIHSLHELGDDALPKTDKGWRDLIESVKGTDDASKHLHDELVAAYGAWIQFSDAIHQSLQDFYSDERLFSPSEQRSRRISEDVAQFNEASDQLGIHISGNAAEYRKLVEEAIKLHGADSEQVAILLSLLPYIDDYNDALREQADILVVSVGSIIDATNQMRQAGVDAADKLISSFQDLAGQSTGDFGQKVALEIGLIQSALSKLGAVQTGGGTTTVHHRGAPDTTVTQPTTFGVPGGTTEQNAEAQELAASLTTLTDQLQRFNALTVQYGADVAEQLVALQDWDTQQKKLFAGNADALAAVDTIFKQRWDAIVSGADSAAKSIDDFIKSLQTLAQSTGGNAGQQATLQLALNGAKLRDLQAQYAKLDPASALAKTMSTDIAKLQKNNDDLAMQLAHFTTYTAQYGEDVANQLVQLEINYEQWKQQVGNNADALAVLADIFKSQWDKIVSSTKTGVSDLVNALKGIVDYLNSLKISDLSPLTPMQKLDQAGSVFSADLVKAQAGDLEAIQKITQDASDYLSLARDAFASSQKYTDIFNSVTAGLNSLLGLSSVNSGTSAATVAAAEVEAPAAATVAAPASSAATNVQPITAPVAAAVPSDSGLTSLLSGALPNDGSRLASGSDVRALSDRLASIQSSIERAQETLSIQASAVPTSSGNAPSPTVEAQLTVDVERAMSQLLSAIPTQSPSTLDAALAAVLPEDGTHLASNADVRTLVGRVDMLDGVFTDSFERFLAALRVPAASDSTNVTPITQREVPVSEAPVPVIANVSTVRDASASAIMGALPNDGSRLASGADIKALGDRMEALETAVDEARSVDAKALQDLIRRLVYSRSASTVKQ